ncbi:rRNA biogenesis protein rrp36 [Tilletia horrida]|nr:rRNA biogenesis protein rrp36 [Tilletia horrida]
MAKKQQPQHHCAQDDSDDEQLERKRGYGDEAEDDDAAAADSFDEEELSEDDVQRPRYAAYHGESDEDDEDEDGEDGEDEDGEEDEEDDGDADRESQLRKQMGSLPLSALLKARAALDADQALADADDDNEDSYDDKEGDGEDDGPEPENFHKERKEISKRADKSAPTEMSSKKPVTRKRQVIDVRKNQTRDPRFGTLSTSELNTSLFTRSYGFIDQSQSAELSALRTQYADLRRAVAARCPSDERAAKGKYSAEAMAIRAERDRVVRLIKRLESVGAEKERREREAEVKRNLRKVNEERGKVGQQPVYLKRAQMKGVILQDKFERLASQGNKSKSKSKSGTRDAALPQTASNMSVDRLRALIASGSRGNTAPSLNASNGYSNSADADASSSGNAAIRKLMVRKAKKEAKKDRRDLPFLVRGEQRSEGGAGAGAGPSSAASAAGSKRRARGSRGGSGAKKARTQ